MSAIEGDSPEHVENSKPANNDLQFNKNMYFYGREVCFFLAVIFTSYAALQNAPPKVSKILPALPFFPRDSPVTDFYQGELSPAFEKIAVSDLSFIMYYAPWDAESQTVKTQFSLLASYFKDEVYFAAVNCWHPTGECRRHFAKVQQFPVLIAYPALRGKGVQFRGIRKAPHMARFLQTALRPLARVEAPSDVLSLMASHDAVAVGCVDMLKQSRSYQALYIAALRALEKDPFQEVAFAIATSKAACQRLGSSGDFSSPVLKLYLWNETLLYSGEWAGDSIVKWVFSSIHQVAVWVSLPGNKALSLAPYVEEGPALLLFTPRNPYYKDTPYFELLREVGLDYYNCNNNSWVHRLAEYLGLERSKRKQRHHNAEKSCFSSRLRESASVCIQTTGASTCATVLLPGVTNVTAATLPPDVLSKGWNCQDSSFCDKDPWTIENCLIPSLQYIPPEPVGNITSISLDDRITSLSRRFREQRCRNMLLGRKLQRAVFPRRSAEDGLESLQGLACSNNRSLSLLALDSLEFYPLAQQLGVDLMSRPDRTVAVIFNAGQESHFVLEETLTKQSLAMFLVNHTYGLLDRSLRSIAPEPYTCLKNAVCIKELNTSNFLPTILKNDQDVVLLYHSPFCGLCGTASLAFLTAARVFKNTPGLEFARIDGENNDLPWEFTMEEYPTIIFFPAERKSESRVFPNSKPLTVETLTHFILVNLRPDSRLQTLLGLHGGSHLTRRHTLAALHEVLAQRRRSKRPQGAGSFLKWRRLLQRTQYLRLLHLALAAAPLQQDATVSLNRYHSLLAPHRSEL